MSLQHWVGRFPEESTMEAQPPKAATLPHIYRHRSMKAALTTMVLTSILLRQLWQRLHT